MPPKVKQPKGSTSTSRDLVSVGRRDIVAKNQTKRNEKGERPSTARALVLRDGKYGARGTGELMVAPSKLLGREKLDLIAEDIMEKVKKAIAAPFQLEKCLKIAQAQCNAYLDDITNLHDHELFYSIIDAEIQARTVTDDKQKPNPRHPSHIASIISMRIHNVYMLASAWKMVLYALIDLGENGLQDRTVKSLLRSDEHMRSRYLALYDLVNVLVNMDQSKFAVLATTTPHYKGFFKKAENTDPDEPEMVFDWAALKEACKSFLDSIIVELCFPKGRYPKRVLYQILHDAVEECPREAKRFPQALWDAVGDLSVSVELLDLLEVPLLGPEGDKWKQLVRQMPEEYENWVDAQIYSLKASEKYNIFKDIVYPLEKTKVKTNLENLWKNINLNYISVCGDDINSLWELDNALQPNPQWHGYVIPEMDDFSDDEPVMPRLQAGNKKPLAITSGNDEYDSMPDLQSVSDSTASETEESSNDGFNDYTRDSEDDESGYDTEEEDHIRELLREAVDTAIEHDFLNSANAPPELDPLVEERKDNPFLKLLTSLRGRMFTSNPRLKTSDRVDPRRPPKPSAGAGAGAGAAQDAEPSPSTKPTTTASKLASPPARPQEAPKSHKPTIEEIDEDQPSVTKKKKKPKKKKRPASVAGTAPATVSSAPASLGKETTKSLPLPTQAPSQPNPSAKFSSGLKKPVAEQLSSVANTSVSASASTASLPLSTTAQSTRSYLQENPVHQKNKIKSRADHASMFFGKKDIKKSVLSRFGLSKDRSKNEPEKEQQDKSSWFTQVSKKTKEQLQKLLHTSHDKTGGMKWDDFCEVMEEMGFDIDPTSAGSRVRFDPKNRVDKSITFHKPHPDPTIHPIRLKEYGKKLKKYYGWDEDALLKISV